MPLGADIICLPMACLCLAQCERGRARGALILPTATRVQRFLQGTAHTSLFPKPGAAPVRPGMEIPKAQG